MAGSPNEVETPIQQPDGGRWVYAVPGSLPAGESALIDLREMLSAVWARRVWIALFGVFCGALSSIYAFQATPWYRADVTLVPVDRPALPASLGQLGGLAGLAGISLPTGGSVEPVAMLRSRELLREFIEKHDLMPILYSRQWDSKAMQWREADEAKRPDIRDAVRYFDRNVRKIVEDKRSGLITLSVEWKDPMLAASWASQLVSELNERARKRALEESQRNVELLQKELAGTTLVALQQSTGRVLETEMQKLVLARASDEFALKTIDAAVPPRWPQRPNKPLVVGLSVVGGLMLIAAVFLVIDRRRWIPSGNRS